MLIIDSLSFCNRKNIDIRYGCAIFFKYYATEVKMSNLYRFGIAVDRELVDEFDIVAKESGYANRSEAIRDIMRNFVIEKKTQQKGMDVVGSFTMIYNHRKRISDKLTEYQHKHNEEIISTLHIHLTEECCLEILALKGKSENIKKIADSLLAQKGVMNGKLVLTAI